MRFFFAKQAILKFKKNIYFGKMSFGGGLFGQSTTNTTIISTPATSSNSNNKIYIFKNSQIWPCTIGTPLPLDQKSPSFVVDDSSSKSFVRLFADSATCPDRDILQWNNAAGYSINLERSDKARQLVFYCKNEVPLNGCLDVWEWTPTAGIQNFSSQNQFSSIPTRQLLNYVSSTVPQITN